MQREREKAITAHVSIAIYDRYVYIRYIARLKGIHSYRYVYGIVEPILVLIKSVGDHLYIVVAAACRDRMGLAAIAIKWLYLV